MCMSYILANNEYRYFKFFQIWYIFISIYIFYLLSSRTMKMCVHHSLLFPTVNCCIRTHLRLWIPMATWLLRSVACRARRWVWKSWGMGSAWLCLTEACTLPTGSGTLSPDSEGDPHVSRAAIPVPFSCWENLRIWWGIFREGGWGHQLLLPP